VLQPSSLCNRRQKLNDGAHDPSTACTGTTGPSISLLGECAYFHKNPYSNTVTIIDESLFLIKIKKMIVNGISARG
jgi:hypothetical protein